MAAKGQAHLEPPDAFDRLKQKADQATPIARQHFRLLGITGEALLRAVAPVGPTKEYRNQITHEIQGDRLTVLSRARHRVQVEDGRRPGRMPPPLAIARRLGIPVGQAFVVARAIGRRGTKGLHPVARARSGMDSATDRTAGSIGDDWKHEMETGW